MSSSPEDPLQRQRQHAGCRVQGWSLAKSGGFQLEGKLDGFWLGFVGSLVQVGVTFRYFLDVVIDIISGVLTGFPGDLRGFPRDSFSTFFLGFSLLLG